jgi:hypothetical protein
MNKVGLLALAGVVSLVASSQRSAHAALVLSLTDANPLAENVTDDGVINPGEYAADYQNGGGVGFGGALGNGSVHLDSDGSFLYVGFDPGADLNDIVVLYFSTAAGGFSDADMNDQQDGARRAVSNAAANADDAFPVLPEFAVAIGPFGTATFQLNAGNTPGHLSFITFQNDQTGNSPALAREMFFSLAALGFPTAVDFFGAYVADSGFGSNESLPASPGLNGGGNVGFDNTSPGYANHNRFVLIPEPAALGVITLGGLALLRRRSTR